MDREELREKILTSKNMPGLLLWLAMPLVVSGSLDSIYSVIDTFWLSLLGKEALATPNVSWPYTSILFAVGLAIAGASSGIAGQYIGDKNYKEASRTMGIALGILLLFGVPASILFALSANKYLVLANVPEEVRVLARVYIVIIAASIPLIYVFLVFNFALGAVGDTRTPMKISIATTLINAALDPVLIFLAGWGVAGAALATAIARGSASLYAIHSFRTGRHGVKIELADLKPDVSRLKLIGKVALPIVFQRVGVTLGFTSMVPIISGLGTPVLAAYAIGQVVLHIDHVIAFPLIRATSIVVAQSLGAEKIDRARKAAFSGIAMIVAAVGIFIAVLLAIRNLFVDIFTDDPVVAQIAKDMLLIFGPSVLGFNLLMLSDSIGRASGHTLFVSLAGLTRLWLLRIPLSWFLAYKLGYNDTGLWAGMAISNYVSGIIGLAWILRGSWCKPVIK